MQDTYQKRETLLSPPRKNLPIESVAHSRTEMNSPGTSLSGSPALRNYLLDGTYDEMFSNAGAVREHYVRVLETFTSLPSEEIRRRKHSADMSFLNQGITFNVYGDEEGSERIFPYDLVPRVIPKAEWNV